MKRCENHVDGRWNGRQMEIIEENGQMVMETSRRMKIETEVAWWDALDGRLRRRRRKVGDADRRDASATAFASRIFALVIESTRAQRILLQLL